MDKFKLSKNIYVAGAVSLFMDISSEMVYPLVPLFLSSALGVNKSVIGLIEGVAESTASILKVFSGWMSDRIGRRKGLMMAGYGISTASRPVIALAGSWHAVLGFRFMDRLGKGVRTAPRDAIIAESAEAAVFGRAFGFHRAMDTVGAVIGPALAFLLLSATGGSFRAVFWSSLLPGAAAVLLILLIVEKRRSPAPGAEAPRLRAGSFSPEFKRFVFIAALFSLGNSSDVFLILKARQEGIPLAVIPLVYMMFNFVYSMSALPAGIAADRFGKRRVILLGFALFALVYAGFAVAKGPLMIWALFGAYGVFMGLTEGIHKAYLASIMPPELKATAFGVYNTAVGLALLPASIIGGWLWDHAGPAATFYYGSATAAVSAVLFVVLSVQDGP